MKGPEAKGCGGSQASVGVRIAHDGGQDAPWEGHRWVAFLHVDIGLVLFSRKEDEKYTCVSYQAWTASLLIYYLPIPYREAFFLSSFPLP